MKNTMLKYTLSIFAVALGHTSSAQMMGGLMIPSTPSFESQYPVGSVFCSTPTVIADVTNPSTGKTWMDRNLGASQVATSSNDTAAYGDLYQWGRRSDGHQCRNSATTSTISSTDQPVHGDFIIGNSFSHKRDWRIDPGNVNLWQGANGINNPCPQGYRVPTTVDWNAELLSWISSDTQGAINSILRLPMAGYRNWNSGGISLSSIHGYYTSNPMESSSFRGADILRFFNNVASMSQSAGRTVAYSVRCIKEIEASLGALNCSSATTNGAILEGQALSGVSSSVPYTGGNGGFYAAQSVSSSDVSGLTATLAAGLLANGSGTLVYTITGTPTTSGTASFAITVGGQSCTFTISVAAAAPQYPAGTVNCAAGPTAIVDVTNPTTGKIWMDRNLGATQVAISSANANSYGDLYQWGRRADGHQCRTSPTTATLSSVNQPAHGNFIIAPNSPYDWRSPQNTNLWQGVNGVNNPCPSGYRLPTQSELNAERLSWSQNNSAGAFASPLRLPMAGTRSSSNGSVGLVGTNGRYWSSTVSGTISRYLNFSSSVAIMNDGYRAIGFSVRCLKE